MVFPEFSLLSISSFITYLHHTNSIKQGSIKVYLSGIHFFYKLIYGQQCPNISNPQIFLLIKGLQKKQSPPSRHQITPNNQPPQHLLYVQVHFPLVVNHDIIHFNIKTSKTDQLKRGHSIFIFNLPTPIQPYQSIALFLHQRKSQITPDIGSKKNLKIILNRSGIPTKHFSSHSFRIGAATTVAQRGLSEHQIKMLGRWTSHTFKSYVRADLHHIRQAHQSLVSF